MTADFSCLDTLFPKVDSKKPIVDPSELHTDIDSFVNYKGIESDNEVNDILLKYKKAGYLKTFDSLDAVKAYLGDSPVLTKIGCVKKEKVNPNTKTVTKKCRIIVDSKQAMTTAASRRTHKSNLPTATVAAKGILGLMDSDEYIPGECDVELLIADVSDAFWLVPLKKSERKFFVIRFRGEYLVFVRTAQGSRGAPLSWAAVGSILARVVQSVFCSDGKQTARMQLYVDDPLIALRGSKRMRKRMAVKFVAVFLVLGVGLAFSKAQLGHTVTWIGVEFAIQPWELTLSIPLEKLQDLDRLISEMLLHNVISIRDLRSFAGKCCNISSLLYMWRPFLSQLWAALSDKDTNSSSRAPLNCVWTKQIRTTLHWIKAFISRQKGTISRKFTFDAFYGCKNPMVIVTDASVYGLGGWIMFHGKPLAWFSEDITEHDEKILSATRGDNISQQIFENLALLVAVKLWSSLWKDKRVSLCLKTDNLGALYVLSSFSGSTHSINLIAREYALFMADGAYAPETLTHIPGITNTIADILSRRNDPQYRENWKPPEFLASAKRVYPPIRNDSWWLSRVVSQS